MDNYNFDICHHDDDPFAVVVDVETTGLINEEGIPTKKKLNEWDEGYPRIVQIAWIVLSRKYRAVSKGAYVIYPTKKIPARATEIHGISTEMAKEVGFDLKKVLFEFRSQIEYCDYYIGHNVQFDKYVIEAECIRQGVKKPFSRKTSYDTMKMGKSFMEKKWFKLSDIATKFKIQFQKPPEDKEISYHNAEYDVATTAAIFCALHSRDVKY